MSVAINNSATAQFSKNSYDAEFDVGALIPDSNEEDEDAPAKMCALTCTVSCAITVSI